MARKRKRRIPKAWIRIDPSTHTTSIRNPRTGKMLGRRRVERGPGDRTHAQRISRGEFAGQIVGRTHPIPIRGSKKQRAHLRRRL